MPMLEEADELAGRLGDERLLAYARNYRGLVASQTGDVKSIEYSGYAARWFRTHHDHYGLRLALLLIGLGHRAAGNPQEAVRCMREAVTIARSFGRERELAITQQTLGMQPDPQPEASDALAVPLAALVHEQAHRLLLTCWTRAGHPARAFRHYERLAALLHNELEMEPETIALHERIKAAELAP